MKDNDLIAWTLLLIALVAIVYIFSKMFNEVDFVFDLSSKKAGIRGRKLGESLVDAGTPLLEGI